MDDNIRTKLAEISAQWRSAGKIGPAVSKSVSQAYELGKSEGIKEGMRRAAEIAESWGLEKVAKWGHDEEMLVDAKSRAWDGLQIKAAILKEAGE